MDVAYLIIKPIASLQGIEIREVKNYLHPQHHLQIINITEVVSLVRACTEQ